MKEGGGSAIFNDRYDFKKTKLKTLLDRLSNSYNVAGNQAHFVKVIDSKAAVRYIDDTSVKASEFINK